MISLSSDICVVNVVGTGKIPTKVNYDTIINNVDIAVVEYEPSIHQGLELRFIEEGPLITVYSTGKYIIRAENVSILYETRKSFLNLMKESGVIESANDEDFNINNIVCNADIGQELELEVLAEDLSRGEAKYDQDRFPGIHYRPENHSCSLLIFRSGKVVITAASDEEMAQQVFNELENEIQCLIDNDAHCI